MKHRKPSSFAVASAAVLLLLGPCRPLPAADSPAEALKVTVLAGQNVTNAAKHRESQTLSVRVEDAAGTGVPAAVVVFNAPSYGASGAFLDDLKTLEVTTDAHGVASASGFRPNSVGGSVAIQVKAVYGIRTGFTVIQQTNEGSTGISKKTWWIVGAIAVAGAGGGAFAALHGKSSSSTSISAGGVTVGAPH